MKKNINSPKQNETPKRETIKTPKKNMENTPREVSEYNKKMQPMLYIPPEIWEHILSYVEPPKKTCPTCSLEYCRICLDKQHFMCSKCKTVVCTNTPGVTHVKCQYCPARQCSSDCMTFKRLNKGGNATHFAYGCEECVTRHMTRLSSWDCVP